jgi:uncharacterized damage-inducible protein DinB
MSRPLLRLYDHLDWAHRQVLQSLGRMPEPPAEALHLLTHLLAAERIWLGRIRGEGNPPQVWPEALDLAGCARWQAENAAGYRALLASLDDAALDAPVAYRNSKGEPGATKLEDILLHVALHGSHHRGQIATLVKRAGGVPAATDYFLFAKEPPPGNAE